MTKTREWILIGLAAVLVAYAIVVAAFELNIGLRQPQSSITLVMHTLEDDGSTHRRVLGRIEEGDDLFVAVNHWPRAWYRQALENPEVRATVDGVTRDYRAVPVSLAKEQQLQQRFPLNFSTRVMTGFPPRHFLQLEPR
jgi:hypothetical protein